MSAIIEKARAYRAKIEDTAQVLDDEEALDYPDLFPFWSQESVSYVTGTRVRYNDKLYKVLQDHTSQQAWNPVDAPSLFAEVLPGQDGTEIGVWQQPDSTNPYMTGDKVHFPTMEDPIYQSLIDGNVWSPETYPAGWAMI